MYKGLKGKARIPTDDLIPKNRRCRNQHSLVFQIPSASKDRIPIRKASFPKHSGTGMPSLIHSSPLPNCRTIAYLNSLPLLELGTNIPRPSPGEVLSFVGVSPVNYSDSDSDTAMDRNVLLRTVMYC